MLLCGHTKSHLFVWMGYEIKYTYTFKPIKMLQNAFREEKNYYICDLEKYNQLNRLDPTAILLQIKLE